MATDEVVERFEALQRAIQRAHEASRRGWVDAEWGVSDNNRRARYYTLTPAGRKQLAAEEREFERIVGAIRLVLQLA